ncbi:MAG: hypothetical protein ACKO37_08685 [Vampirovibrionales bacterium]
MPPILSKISQSLRPTLKKMGKAIRSVHSGGNANDGIQITTDSVTKNLKGASGLKEAQFYWETQHWSQQAKQHVPLIQSIRMSIDEGKKPEAERIIKLTTNKAKGKPLSRYLHHSRIYHEGYDGTLEALEAIRKDTSLSIKDRHPDNVFISINPKTKKHTIQFIDLDPKHTHTRGSEADSRQHIDTYKNSRIKRLIRHTGKSALALLVKPIPNALIQKLPSS